LPKIAKKSPKINENRQKSMKIVENHRKSLKNAENLNLKLSLGSSGGGRHQLRDLDVVHGAVDGRQPLLRLDLAGQDVLLDECHASN
jgi:hypothetical protein